MLTIYFWQNIISPHQLPYISQLPFCKEVSKIFLIVSENLSVERQKMGWDIEMDSLKNITLIVAPTEQQINTIYKNSPPNSVHFYSGIRAFPFIFNAFKIGLSYPVKRGLISEHPFTYKKPIILHYIRTLLFDYKYFRHIDYVFAIGERAQKWFNRWYSKWKVFSFGYCVDSPVYRNQSETGTIKIIFIGSLIALKNVQIVIKSLHKIKDDNYTFEIIGNGDQLNPLKKLCTELKINDKVIFKGIQDRSTILNTLYKNDILILPSLMDGWGAVINEALMSGLYVICSNRCGAKDLIETNQSRGVIFNAKSVEDLTLKLVQTLKNIDIIRTRKEDRKRWSECITGRSMAEYFVQCLTIKNVIPPWKKN